MSNLTQVSEADFNTTVLESKEPVLVDFYADWCTPCKMIAPVLDELAVEYDGRLNIVKVNVDDAPGVASTYGIMSIPALVFFSGGKPQQSLVGVKPKPAVKAAVEKLLAGAASA